MTAHQLPPSRRTGTMLVAAVAAVTLAGCTASRSASGEPSPAGAPADRSAPSATTSSVAVGILGPYLAASASAASTSVASSAAADGTVAADDASPPMETGVPAGAEIEQGADPSGKAVVYLTFDDGPSMYTLEILKVLQQYGAKATFFQLGNQVVKHPEISRLVVEDGHRIGNHSWSHPFLTKLSAAEVESQLVRTSRAISHATGRSPHCARPPYGATSARIKSIMQALGMHQQMWTMTDADTAQHTMDEMIALMSAARDGSVVLMHDGGGKRERTVELLERWLAANHDRFIFRVLPRC